MIRRPPRSTRPDTLCPDTPLCRSRLGLQRPGNHRQPRHLRSDRRARRTRQGERNRPLPPAFPQRRVGRSEEHTSELQSLMRISYAVFCLKKKIKQDTTAPHCTMTTNLHKKTTASTKEIHSNL